MHFVIASAEASLYKLDRALAVLENGANLRITVGKCVVIPFSHDKDEKVATLLRRCKHCLAGISVVGHTKLLGVIVGPDSECRAWEPLLCK